MLIPVDEILARLKTYCEKEDYKGWDPYDGLNSRLLNRLPWIGKNRLVRLVWIQAFKKNPLNLRGIAGVDKGLNPKGLGLFLSAYCHLYKDDNNSSHIESITLLADKLLELKSTGYSGPCWGYNFDWQAKAFFQPKYSPTVVASAYVGYALLDAWEITGNDIYKNEAVDIAKFIINDLNRSYDKDGDFAFSYSPLDHTRVINASLLGTKMLSRIYSITGDISLLDPAAKSAAFCCKLQNEDGSWPYGTLPYHQWIDNFHTGFNIECLNDYQKFTGDNSFSSNIDKGLAYYMENFFTPEGMPKYYNNSLYPVDVHSAAQLIVTIYKIGKYDKYSQVINRVISWITENMYDKKGYFYFQAYRLYKIKIPYMRWSQAWMFYALALFRTMYEMPAQKTKKDE